MNFAMDRASEAAANNLADVRKLIEGMSTLINSQQQQQQQQQQLELEKQQKLIKEQQRLAQQQKEQQQLAQQQQQLLLQQQQEQAIQQSPIQQKQLPSPQTLPQHATQNTTQYATPNTTQIATQNEQQHVTSPGSFTESQNWSSQPNQKEYNQDRQVTTSAQVPINGIIIEVNHLCFNRTLYFQLSPDATIEPLVAWLKLSFQDSTISGMVLQYKGFDSLWKCLLNRDDSLKRVLKQSLKNNTMLQMRVPREQDLLSSGYTDKRLLALTTKLNTPNPHLMMQNVPQQQAETKEAQPQPSQ